MGPASTLHHESCWYVGRTPGFSFPFCSLPPFCDYPGLDIESSLKQLAERRTDIFGVEETAIGKKIGEEEIQKPEEKVTF